MITEGNKQKVGPFLTLPLKIITNGFQLSVPVHLMLQRSLFVVEASVGILARGIYPQSEMPIQLRVCIHQEQTPVTTGQGKDKKGD